MTLYILQAEIFAGYIRKNPEIRGITLNNKETKLQQYADDTNFYLSSDNSLKALDNALNVYKLATGAKLNTTKCQGLWLGMNRSRIKENFLNFSWDNNTLQSLGITLSNTSKYINRQWDESIKTISKKIDSWKRFNLSIKGKAIIINQTLLSSLWHLAFTIPIPSDKKIKTIERKIESFLWNNSTVKTPRQISKLAVDQGGLNIIDVKKKLESLQMSWISKLHNENKNGAWKDSASYILNQY
jgi:hypothetical protein